MINKTSNQHILSIWFIHDQRPGHLNQLKGLAAQLQAHHDIKQTWIDTSSMSISWKEALLKKTSNKQQPRPDVVIGAGHKTHKLLVFAAHIYSAFSVVLMKPSLPLFLFDAVICPEHDGLSDSTRILTTQGALNKVKPALPDAVRTKYLMLIGGPSKHFAWQEEVLLKEIEYICRKYPDKEWLLSDSPRTPSVFIEHLDQAAIPNLHTYSYRNNTLNDLPQLLQHSAMTWLTPDSVSMVYESLTAGSPSALFSMKPGNERNPGRLVRAIQALVDTGHVSDMNHWRVNPNIQAPATQLWEADRAAKWLLTKLT